MYVCRCGAARRYPCAAQTVRIDTTVALNTIPPRDAVGAGINCIPVQAIDRDLTKQALVPVLQSGMAARDLSPEHGACGGGVALKPGGHLERRRGEGCFIGSSMSTGFVRHSYGYGFPHRGVTRNDGTGKTGYSRLTDRHETTYWKSNPYLTSRYTGEDDALHPQW
jgi:hypothetical protein